MSQKGRVRLTEAAAHLRPGLLNGRVALERTRVEGLSRRLTPALTRPIEAQRRAFAQMATRLDPARLLRVQAEKTQEFQALAARLARVSAAGLEREKRRLEAVDRMRQSLGYKATLARGFAVVCGDGELVTGAKAAGQAAALEIEFADGKVTARPDGRAKAKPAPKPAKKPPEQGSLF